MLWKFIIKKNTLICALSLLFPLVTASVTIAMPKSNDAQGGPTASGKVVETMDAAGYTYMLIESATGNSWVAIPESDVTTGAQVTYFQGMAMKDFSSKSLGRTFETIVFSPGLANEADRAAPQPATTTDDSFSAAVQAEQATPKDATQPMGTSGGSSGAVVPLGEIRVEKSTAANGYTVEEMFAKAKDLHGQKVQIRGKVVKFSPLIMGRNWIHLQDGTGDPMQNSHDLVVTSTETVEVDSVVLMEGILASEKDFGAGYKYAVIVENGTVVNSK